MKTVHTKRATDLFKPARRGDQLTCVYLYTDRHAVAAFERYDRDTNTRGRYYKQIDDLGISIRFKGRVIFSGIGGGITWLRAAMAAQCSAIGACAPGLGNGTPVTDEKGIKIGYVVAETSFGTLYDYDFPGLMSGGTSYQSDVDEAFNPNMDGWGLAPLTETLITKAKP